MAYLTVSNSIRILRGTDVSKLEDNGGVVYKRPIYFFSKHEKKILLGLQELWKDPKKFIARFYKQIDSTDNFKYVFEGGKPAYHNDSTCSRLNSNFKNFEIPDEIKKRGKKEVLKFRIWFKQNSDLMKKPDMFAMRLFHAFKIQVNVRAINYDNSGVEEKENLNLQELENRIDQILREAGKFWHENPERQPIIRRFQKIAFLWKIPDEINNNNTELSDSELKDFLKYYDTKFKSPIKHLLIEYYRVKLNPNLQFEGNLLEQLGFIACKSCKGDLGNEIYKEVHLNRKKNDVQISNQYTNVQNNLSPDEQKSILNGLNW